ncbi:Protein kinase domain-containing protein [Psidium guajava]|nr:Protein kinase domain-containing protein [Psidium guajava]
MRTEPGPSHPFCFPDFLQPPDLALPSSMAVVTFAGVALHPDLAIHGQTRSGVVSLVHGRRRLRATPEGAMAARDDSSFAPAPTAVQRRPPWTMVLLRRELHCWC